MIHEGFWSSNNVPSPQKWSDDERTKFLNTLELVENMAKITRYRGFSLCRICMKNNGSREFSTKDAVWPEGFRHYVVEHNIKPTKKFLDYISLQAESSC